MTEKTLGDILAEALARKGVSDGFVVVCTKTGALIRAGLDWEHISAIDALNERRDETDRERAEREYHERMARLRALYLAQPTLAALRDTFIISKCEGRVACIFAIREKTGLGLLSAKNICELWLKEGSDRHEL